MAGHNYRVVPSEWTTRATAGGTAQFQLLAGTVPVNLSSVGTVELHLRDRAGATVTFTTVGASPALVVNGTAGGSVTLVPGTGGLIAGSAPYNGYFKLWRGTNQWEFVPESYELTINVRKTLG